MKMKSKIITSYIMCIILILSLMTTGPITSYASSTYFAGEGTESSPYQIITAADLVQLATLVNAGDLDYNSKYYQLENDVDLSEITNWAPIGSSSSFNGIFSGAGHQIQNLKIMSTYNGESTGNFGLFDTNMGTIKDLQLTNADIQITGSGIASIGGIVAINNGVIDNCSVSGIIENTSSTDNATRIGGIACVNEGTITNCINMAEISSTGLAAGIAVWNGSYMSSSAVVVDSCTNKGLISGPNAAGISVMNHLLIMGSKNYGEINSTSSAAGIAAFNDYGTISQCLNEGDVTTISSSTNTRALAGGIASYTTNGMITESSNSASVSLRGTSSNTSYPGSSAGGIVGLGYGKGEIINCSNTGTVNNSISSGMYLSHAGGIAGGAYSTSIKNAFNSGAISGNTTRVGGIAGTIQSGSPENCYYLSNIPAGAGYYDGPGTMLACTLEQMYKQDTFAGFDFSSIWMMPVSAHVPVLQSLYVPLQGISISDFSMVTGESRQAPLVFIPDDALLRDCTWTSSNPAVVSVNQSGIVVGHIVGTATIFVESRERSFVDSCTINVRQGVERIDLASSRTLNTDTSIPLTATVSPGSAYNKTLKWSSSDPGIAQVDSSGRVTGIAPGSAVIRATAEDGSKVTATCAITVLRPVTGISVVEASLTVSVGKDTALTINVTPADASNQSVTCSSDNTAIATVSKSGVVTGVSRGYATITVTTVDRGFTVSRLVEVIQTVSGITLNYSNTGIALGKQEKLIATIQPANANNQRVIWSSNDESVATVSDEGVVSGINAGSAVITAKSEDGSHTAYCAITVGQGVVSIDVTGPGQVNRNSSIQMNAAVSPETAVNNSVTWSVMPGTGAGTIDANGLFTGTDKGTVTVVATATDGTGIKGEKTVTVIELVSNVFGMSRYSTAVAISQASYASASTAILVLGTNFPDALSAGPLAIQENAPILLTKTAVLPQETSDELIRLGVGKVIILGGESVVGPEVVAALTNLGIATERISGNSRYETAIAVARQVRAKSGVTSKVILTNGWEFADALSIGSYASKEGIPILLTKADVLQAATKAALLEFGVEEIIVIGGNLAVSEAIIAELQGMGITITRSFGSTRFETVVAVAEKYFPTANKAIVSYGFNFADALSAAPYVAMLNAPIVLVRQNLIPTAISEYISRSTLTSVIVIGGNDAVGVEVKSALEGLLIGK